MAAKEKAPKVRKPDYIGAKKFWAWESRELSDAGMMFLMGYFMFFCTDVLKLDPLLTGTVLAATRTIDGVTDVLFGYVVDRTNTRWGRGRPYDICLVGAWVCAVMLFLCPVGWSTTAKLTWVAIWYILCNAVFYTFLNAGEGVFMLRAFTRPQIIKLSTQGAIATSMLGFSCGVLIPQLVQKAGKDPGSWARLAIMLGVPLALIGLCRMIFVKEENEEIEAVDEKVKTDLKDIFTMLGKNKYLIITSIILLIGNTVSNMGVGVYYFDKVLGNLGIQSIFSAFSALAVFALVLLPKLMKKFPLARILIVGQLIAAVLYLVSFIFYNNIPILVFCYVVSIFATLPGVYAGRILMVDMAEFNEYIGLNRMEGTMASVQGFMRRAGSAVGAFLLGLALKIIQYDQDATVLAPITFWGLRVVMYGVPLISALVQAVLWTAYDLEAKMPEIKTELARRAGKAAPAEEAPAEEAPAEL